MKRLQGYTAERVVAMGTGSEEGSVLISAKKWNQPLKRIVVVITPEFMGELARYITDYVSDVPGVEPQPATPQPVIDANYGDDEPSDDPPDPEPRELDLPPEGVKVIDLMTALKEALAQ